MTFENPYLTTQHEQAQQQVTLRFAARTMLEGLLRRNHRAVPVNLSPEDAHTAEQFEQQHFVADAPLLSDMTGNDGSNNIIRYRPSATPTRGQEYANIGSPLPAAVEITEHDAIDQTVDFLKRVRDTSTDDASRGSAEHLLSELSFISETKLQEAASGIAARWKDYLAADLGNKLCVPTDVIHTGEEMKKSSGYVFDKVISHFSPDEMTAYSGRISQSLDGLDRSINKTKIVLLDDASISGAQIASGMSRVMFHPKTRGGKWEEHVEINLIAATDTQLQGMRPQGRPIPTFAYYRTMGGESPLVTNFHSSVDFGFEKEIATMVTRQSTETGQPVMMPPLTNIVRPYRPQE